MTSECHLILDRNIDLFNYENFSLQFKYIARHSTYNNTVPQVVTYDKFEDVAYEEGWGNAFGLFVSDRTLYDDGDLYSFESFIDHVGITDEMWKKEFRSYYDNITKQSHDFFFH